MKLEETIILTTSAISQLESGRRDDGTRLLAVYYRLALGMVGVEVSDCDAIRECKRCNMWDMTDQQFDAYKKETVDIISKAVN